MEEERLKTSVLPMFLLLLREIGPKVTTTTKVDNLRELLDPFRRASLTAMLPRS